ncbi:Histone acetyltransferase complex SAGA/ADA, subunit ADA2 [Pseudoloma neurophilia]|uniref:Histone acetyltransferase complex SAGA/ADA, subunit ADA2 n=1 Tax=Pseudoloma neurophilia TaxID=146866 RepID=A0A0R0M163_9MICR|nr:Histone acetyltransferase complex SAGA/ADA, subunit ADA2 [Pseudoloma neurophilia]
MTITNFESSKQIVILCDFCFQEITYITRIKCECHVDICIKCFYSTGCEYFGNISALEKYHIDRNKIPKFKENEKEHKSEHDYSEMGYKSSNKPDHKSNNKLDFKSNGKPDFKSSDKPDFKSNDSVFKSNDKPDHKSSDKPDFKSNDSVFKSSNKPDYEKDFYQDIIVEPYNHIPTHKYFCIEPLNYSILDKKWTVLEELLFFEMLITYGIGNWNEIATNMKTKTVKDIEEHFYLIFEIENNFSLESEKSLNELSNPNSHNLVIYAPKRQDFDFEDEYDQENNLKFLEITESEEIKNFLLDSYENLIILRKLKKMSIIEKGMTEIEKIKEQKEKLQKNNQIIYDICSPLTQFISKNDMNTFFNGLKIENHLLNFKNNQIKASNDIFTIDLFRKEKLSEQEIEIIEKLNITYSTYTKIKKYAIILALKNGNIRTLRNLTIDKRCNILLEFFKKKKLFSI